MCDAVMDDMKKEVHSEPQNIKATSNEKNTSKPQKLLGPLEPMDGVRFDAD